MRIAPTALQTLQSTLTTPTGSPLPHYAENEVQWIPIKSEHKRINASGAIWQKRCFRLNDLTQTMTDKNCSCFGVVFDQRLMCLRGFDHIACHLEIVGWNHVPLSAMRQWSISSLILFVDLKRSVRFDHGIWSSCLKPQPYQAAAQAVTLGRLDTVPNVAPCAARGGLVHHSLGHGG